MLERWPHVCHIKTTFEIIPTNWLVGNVRVHRVHKNELDDMLRNLDSAEKVLLFLMKACLKER